MKYIKVKLVTPGGASPLKGDMKRRLEMLDRLEKQARSKATHAAQRKTAQTFTYIRPATAPWRPGRQSTGGRMRSHLRWRPSSTDTTVVFDVAYADRAAPHWIINEIGTGQRATIKRGGHTNPRGRPGAGATYVRTVRSQRGRVISRGLAWGTAPGGRYVPPGLGSGQQLYPRSTLSGAPMGRRRRQMIIQREIQGKHFVRDGARAGFEEYRRSVRAAAQSAFRRPKRR